MLEHRGLLILSCLATAAGLVPATARGDYELVPSPAGISVPMQLTSFSVPFLIDKFDPSRGTLTDVVVVLSTQIGGQAVGNYSDPVATATITGGATGQVTADLSGFGASPPSVVQLSTSQTFSLPQGGITLGGPAPGPTSFTNTFTTTPGFTNHIFTGPDLAGFIGPGQFSVAIGGTTSGVTLGTSNVASSQAIILTAGASVFVRYDFTPVPEPGGLALMASGLGLGLFVHRRGRPSRRPRRADPQDGPPSSPTS